MSPEQKAIDRAMSLACWAAPEKAIALGGGITNFNVKLTDEGRDYVVRVGDDIPLHQVMRFNELACHRAAEAVGVSPRIVHSERGILAMDYIDGRSLQAADICQPAMVDRIVVLLRRLHVDGQKNLRGPVLMFWVFHILRDYAATLQSAESVHMGLLPNLLAKADGLATAIGQIDVVLGHNDLLPANFMGAGDRLWLIDWDYGGLNSPLFDLAGLASNAQMPEPVERQMLEAYFDRSVDDGLWRKFTAMKAASLLRETMWSMVSEIHSQIDFDYPNYTAANLERFKAALQDFENS